MDVTRRYCRNPIKHGLDRTKAPEAVLLYIMDEIRHARRRNLDKEDKFRLEGEEMLETRELRHYYVSAITAEVARLVPSRVRTRDADAQKALEGRQSGQLFSRSPPVTARHRLTFSCPQARQNGDARVARTAAHRPIVDRHRNGLQSYNVTYFLLGTFARRDKAWLMNRHGKSIS